MTAKAESNSPLALKLIEVIEELGVITKAGENSHFKYAYFTEAQIVGELRLKLAAKHVLILPSVVSAERGEVRSKKDEIQQLVSMTTEHIVMDAETREQFVLRSYGQGLDPGDKASNKAFTGANKFFLMKLFMVSDAESDAESDPTTDKTMGAGAKPKDAPDKHDRYAAPEKPEPAAVASDLEQLKAFLKTEKIPQTFVLKIARDTHLADWEDTIEEVAEHKPGNINILLRGASRLLKLWHETQDAVPGLEKPPAKQETPPPREKPQGESAGRKREYNLDGGDRGAKRQSKDNSKWEPRTPGQTEVDPEEILKDHDVTDWREVEIHFGTNKGIKLGDLKEASMSWYLEKWTIKKYKGKWNPDDVLLDAALCVMTRA